MYTSSTKHRYAASQESYPEELSPKYFESSQPKASLDLHLDQQVYDELHDQAKAYMNALKREELSALIIFLVGFFFFPLWCLNMRYYSSDSTKASRIAIASLFLLTLATAFVLVDFCVVVVLVFTKL